MWERKIVSQYFCFIDCWQRRFFSTVYHPAAQLIRLQLGAHLIFKGFILMSSFLVLCWCVGIVPARFTARLGGLKRARSSRQPSIRSNFFRRKQPLGAAPARSRIYIIRREFLPAADEYVNLRREHALSPPPPTPLLFIIKNLAIPSWCNKNLRNLIRRRYSARAL